MQFIAAYLVLIKPPCEYYSQFTGQEWILRGQVLPQLTAGLLISSPKVSLSRVKTQAAAKNVVTVARLSPNPDSTT